VFVGERGRGGKVIKLRVVAYEKEEVKNLSLRSKTLILHNFIGIHDFNDD
jgi:hypothetical protein